MKKLFESADVFCMESNWKVLAVLKFCLISMGVLIGLALPAKLRKAAAAVAALVFIASYIPIMLRFFEILFREKAEI